MASYKNDPHYNDYDAGDEFDYSYWTANTQLTLCNVPWDATYKDVVHFNTTDDLNRYIDTHGEVATITNSVYAKVDEPISIDTPFGRAQRYNYIRVYNPAQPVDGDQPKYYYYFIRGLVHDAANTTRIVVQLDLWQTWIRNIEFGRAYIDRGHIGIANRDAFRNFGRDFLTIAEGLDTGSDYVNVATTREKIMAPYEINGSGGFSILAISTIDLHGNHGSEKVPLQPSARSNYIQGMPTGAAAYIWDSASEFIAFMADFSTKPWITQGIMSITLIPPVKRYMLPGVTLGPKNPSTRSYNASMFNPYSSRRDLFRNWRNSDAIRKYIPERYRHLDKFLTSPYCMIEATVNAGSAIALRPESWNSDHASMVEKISIMPPSQRVAFIPLNYNGRNKTPEGGAGSWDKDGDYLDMAVFLSAFPTVPIVNNGQIAYLASNARSIAAQYSGLEWSQQRALAGNQTAFDQAGMAIDAGVNQTLNSVRGDQAQTAISTDLASQQALFGLLAGTASGAGMGAFAGPGGALAGGAGGLASGVAGAMSTGLNVDAQNRALAARTNTAYGAANIDQGLGMAMRDSNKGMADWAARGDYANSRSAMDAKIHDTALIPHGMSGQYGGESFNLANDEVDLTLRFKMIDQASIAIVGEFWLRHGYPVRRSARIPNDLRVMDKFSYWKLSEIYIRSGGMPETYKQAIRGILEKGVTVWNNPDDIGVIDFADNRPLPNITIEGYEPPEWEPEPDPEPPVKPSKKRNKKMLVYSVNDGGMKYALAGTAPGTLANWIETESETLKNSFLEATQQDSPVALETLKFYELKSQYLSPVTTVVEPGE